MQGELRGRMGPLDEEVENQSQSHGKDVHNRRNESVQLSAYGMRGSAAGDGNRFSPPSRSPQVGTGRRKNLPEVLQSHIRHSRGRFWWIDTHRKYGMTASSENGETRAAGLGDTTDVGWERGTK